MMLETTQIRKMDLKLKCYLERTLDMDDRWKLLMANVTVDCVPTNTPKYNNEHLKLIETASKIQQRSCTGIFLEEWGTSGRIRPDIKALKDLLFKLKLTRIAEHVASEISGDKPVDKLETSKSDLDTDVYTDNNYSEDFMSTLVVHEQETTSTLDDDQSNMSVGEIKKFSYEYLLKATDGFSDSCLIGSGGFSDVFKAKLNNKIVAIKRMKNTFQDERFIEQYKNEINIVLKFKHDNLLPLLAISYDAQVQPCIVYEFMENGTLLDRIAHKNGLDWKCRIQIGIDVASGLAYLHKAFEIPFIHRDIKSANILLDSKFIAKIGDFGLIRFGDHTQTSVAIGTCAYMSPEANRGDISEKIDVFSFGVVLLELLTGLAPFDKDRDGGDLLTHVRYSIKIPIEELIDKHAGYLNNSIATLIYKLAERCTEINKNERPCMHGQGGVFESLKNIKSEICDS